MNKTMKKLILGIFAFGVIGVTFTSCDDDDDVAPPNPIGGFNNSNEVGGANLKAHWSFDGTNNERLSSTAPIANAANSFVTGLKGQALHLDSGYLLYPTIAGMSDDSLGSVTVSAWIKTQNNGV